MRGVSARAVHHAVKDGRIAAAITPDGKVDVEAADRLWADNTNPDSGYHGQLKRRSPRAEPDLETVIEVVKAGGINPLKPPTLVESKTLQAAYQARLAQIEYEEKSGKLIDNELVKKEAFKLARLTRDAMLAIPDRLAAELAGITDPFVVHQKMMAEVRSAIEEVTKAAAE